MFLWKTSRLLEEIEKHMPELHSGLAQIAEHWQDEEENHRIFSGFPSQSIDFGVMERASRVAVLPCQLGWSDVGNWRALEDVWPPDADGGLSNTPTVRVAADNCIVYSSQGKLVALVGVHDLVVVESPDAVLICPRNRTEDVKQVVEALRRQGLTDYL